MRWLLAACALLLVAPAAWGDEAEQRASGPDGLQSSRPQERAAAARRAAAQGERSSIPRLVELLADDTWTVRLAAVRALHELDAREAKRDLMVLAATDSHPDVRAAAADAVRAMDPRGYVSVLATSDPPPVQPAPPEQERGDAGMSAAEQPPHRMLLGAGLADNALRADETFSGTAAAGLRWRHADLQITLGFPSVTLAGQLRWNILPGAPVVPYLTAGLALAYNNGADDDRGPAASLLGGAGVRIGPWRGIGGKQPSWLSRVYAQVELLASWVYFQRLPPGPYSERSFGLPVLVAAGIEVWP
jgi:hypothetical protein